MGYIDAEAEIRESTTRTQRKQQRQRERDRRWIYQLASGAFAAAVLIVAIVWFFANRG